MKCWLWYRYLLLESDILGKHNFAKVARFCWIQITCWNRMLRVWALHTNASDWNAWSHILTKWGYLPKELFSLADSIGLLLDQLTVNSGFYHSPTKYNALHTTVSSGFLLISVHVYMWMISVLNFSSKQEVIFVVMCVNGMHRVNNTLDLTIVDAPVLHVMWR